jgi:hypothetical protein
MMIRFPLTIFSCLICCNFAFGQASISVPQELLEHWRRATIAFGITKTEHDKQEFRTIASGVLIASDEHHGCVFDGEACRS